ncbi:MAG: hypothetical protein ACFE75_01855 [Candidatus Hodarchaeota archaeon]
MTPDSINYYLKKPNSFVFKILKEIDQQSLDKLKIILDYFHDYKNAAEKSRGIYQEGNIIIGVNPDQYYPSEEEILVPELGKMVKNLIDSNSKKVINKIKKKREI